MGFNVTPRGGRFRATRTTSRPVSAARAARAVCAACVEVLEDRRMMSASPSVTFTPDQVRHAYGFDKVTFTTPDGRRVPGNGVGQTIAIVDAYDNPNIEADLRYFDGSYKLPDVDAFGKPLLTKVRLGTGKNIAKADPAWAQEIAMDVEWAHAMAPSAHLLLVEAPSTSLTDLAAAVQYARQQKNVVAVSMSWNGGEFDTETKYDSLFTTPSGHLGSGFVSGGVTFVTASGDNGAPSGWPAVSPNVLSVGGTSMYLKNGAWAGETGWSYSGGGVSFYEAEPAYQNALAPNVGRRTAPDVAYNANPVTGFSVYDSVPYQGKKGWMSLGGTSAGAPQWAAMIAIADEGRQLAGKHSLDGRTQTLPAIYRMPASNFHEITSGNNGYVASAGFNPVAGRGSPFADRIIASLIRV